MLTNQPLQPKNVVPVKKIRRTQTQWQQIMQEYEASGQNQQLFCAQHGIAMSSFSKWRKNLQASDNPMPTERADKLFVEIATADQGPQSIEPWDVELVLTQGMVLRLKQH